MCVHRCAFCDISVDISSFVNRNPMQLHKARSPNCPLVTGAASNTSLQVCGQISGHHFTELLFGATTEQHKHHLPPGHEHEKRSASQGIPCRTDRFPSSSAGLSLSGQRSEPSSPAVSAADSHRTTIEPARLPAHTPETIRSQAPEPALPMLPAEPITFRAPEPGQPPQPSQPVRTQTTGNALPYQTARLVSPHQQEIASNPRPTETPGRNASSQSGSNVNAAPATPRAGPALQSPPSSTADPPRQLVTYSQLGIYTQEPKRPDLAIATSRVNTYTGWPHATTHTPEEMAEAGFYYVGEPSTCFACSAKHTHARTHARTHTHTHAHCPIDSLPEEELCCFVCYLLFYMKTCLNYNLSDRVELGGGGGQGGGRATTGRREAGLPKGLRRDPRFDSRLFTQTSICTANQSLV